MTEYVTRSGDGHRIEMTADELRRDLIAGSEDTADCRESRRTSGAFAVDISGPVVNTNTSKSMAWNLARARCAFRKPKPTWPTS